MTQNTDKKVDHKNIYEALSAFQGEMDTIEKSKEVKFKTSKNRTISYKYAPLDKIIEEVTPVLAKHGLSFRHELTENGAKVEAILTHGTYEKGYKVVNKEKVTKEDETIENENRVEVVQNELRSGGIKINQNQKMKDVASEITYAKRYTLSMLLGIATEEDKDAKNIEEKSAKNSKKFTLSRVKKSIKECKDQSELDRKEKMLKDDLEKIEKGKAPSLGLDKEHYTELQELLEEKKEEFKKEEKKEEPKDTEEKEEDEEKEEYKTKEK